MAATPGVYLVQQHAHWSDPNQIFSGKITVEVSVAGNSYRQEFNITAADIVSFLAQVLNLLTQLAGTYQVDVQPISSTSWDALSAASSSAQGGWAPS